MINQRQKEWGTIFIWMRISILFVCWELLILCFAHPICHCMFHCVDFLEFYALRCMLSVQISDWWITVMSRRHEYHLQTRYRRRPLQPRIPNWSGRQCGKVSKHRNRNRKDPAPYYRPRDKVPDFNYAPPDTWRVQLRHTSGEFSLPTSVPKAKAQLIYCTSTLVRTTYGGSNAMIYDAQESAKLSQWIIL